MAIDPRTPCLVGVAQHTVRVQPGPEPLDLWEVVAREAARDAGLAPEALESIQIVHCESWSYDDPVARLAERLDAHPGHQKYSKVSGTAPQLMLGEAAARIGSGELDSALVVGAEALATRQAIRRGGEHVQWSHRADPKPPYPWDRPPHPSEIAHGLVLPVHTYAMLDTARRAAAGESVEEEVRSRGTLMAPMTTVAAANPYAWFPVERTAEELITPTADNRYIGWPYTKLTVAIMDVDIAAGAVLVSAELADRLGVPGDKRIYLRGWAFAEDAWEVAARRQPGTSPPMDEAAKAAFARAGLGPDDISAFDLYSCFAIAVRLGCRALDLSADDPRGLTVTGGLPYAGGAGNSYVLNSLASMAVRLRERGGHGLVTGVGMHLTKHTYAVWSSEPGGGVSVARPGYAANVSRLDPLPIIDTHEGPATVAAYTIAHGRDGAPETGILVVDVPGGARTHAHVVDRDLIADAESRELVGQKVRLTRDGESNIATW